MTNTAVFNGPTVDNLKKNPFCNSTTIMAANALREKQRRNQKEAEERLAERLAQEKRGKETFERRMR